jgi:hypothetical protein
VVCDNEFDAITERQLSVRSAPFHVFVFVCFGVEQTCHVEALDIVGLCLVVIRFFVRSFGCLRREIVRTVSLSFAAFSACLFGLETRLEGRRRTV